eukprot:CAMPEP_0171496642 /NCGR_PEP_ID=MMETSP0958-20121227/6820_1 /TAXON_ID=87120 /ORGANISM="Aurantiochytrium limacinum, Strain ATCCMYA-1381" /LENGTH=589 /DNA_ID=CAMNT_0012030777 /DNA_START=352 /DNA_END=2121 /DNA_ORIENTATION=-
MFADPKENSAVISSSSKKQSRGMVAEEKDMSASSTSSSISPSSPSLASRHIGQTIQQNNLDLLHPRPYSPVSSLDTGAISATSSRCNSVLDRAVDSSDELDNEDSGSERVIMPNETRPSQESRPGRSRPRPEGLWVNTKSSSSSESSPQQQQQQQQQNGAAVNVLAQDAEVPESEESFDADTLEMMMMMHEGDQNDTKINNKHYTHNSADDDDFAIEEDQKEREEDEKEDVEQEEVLHLGAGDSFPTALVQEEIIASSSGASRAGIATSEPTSSQRTLVALQGLGSEDLQGTYGQVSLVERSRLRSILSPDYTVSGIQGSCPLVVVKSVPLSPRKSAQHGRSELAVLEQMLHEESENIVKLEFARIIDNHAILVLEYCEQGDLYSVWGCEPLRTSEHLVILADIAQGLACLHRHNIIHGDLKPENIGISRHGTAKLLDFGLSTELKPNKHYNPQNGRLECVTQSGTLAYAAPEIFKRRPHGTETDWWSFAVLVYEALFATWPWQHEDPNIMCDLICQAPVEVPDFLETRESERTPMALRTFFAASFRKSPNGRLGYSLGFEEIQTSRFWEALAPWWRWDPATAYGSASW